MFIPCACLSTVFFISKLSFQLDPPPKYLEERIELFDKLKAEYDAEILGSFCLLFFLIFIVIYCNCCMANSSPALWCKNLYFRILKSESILCENTISAFQKELLDFL